MLKYFLIPALALLFFAIATDAQNSTFTPTPAQTSGSATQWVNAFNSFDSTKNNITIVFQSGEWVQSIQYVRKLEASSDFVRFSYGKDSRRSYRGLVHFSTIKAIFESPITN